MSLLHDEGCTACRLYKTCNTVCLPGVGKLTATAMIVGEAPGRQEDEQGEPFVGKAGKFLTDALADCGIDRDDVFITNAVNCRPPNNRPPSKGEIKACSQWLQARIQAVKPRVVLLLGNTPLQSITGSPGIKKRRGKPFEQDGVIYVPCFHPAYILRDQSQQPAFDSDLRLFAKIIEKGEIPREKRIRRTTVSTLNDVDKMIDCLEGPCSFDIETTGLYPWAKGAAVTMLGFGTPWGEFSLPVNLPDSPWTPQEIDGILARIDDKLAEGDCKLITQNGKFDFLWMLVHYGLEWFEHHEFDVMLAHYVLDENSRHDLKYLAQVFCGAPDYDIDLDKKKGNTAADNLALYHAHDLYYTRLLRGVFLKKLQAEPALWNVFNHIMMPCSRLFTEIESDGVFINTAHFDDAEKLLHTKQQEALKALKKWGDINWGSPRQLANLLFNVLELEVIEKTKGGAPSTSESVLNRLEHPCVSDLLKWREAQKQLSSFIDGWKPFFHTRRLKGQLLTFLHPSFKLHGTVTGRLSCVDPNLQQTPRDELIRSLIDAPPGWVLVEADLSQIELRIAAEIANELTMLKAFHDGIDVHWLTALTEVRRGKGLHDLIMSTAKMAMQGKFKGDYDEAVDLLLKLGPGACAEINKEWKEYRTKAKAINFGYIFGMWWKKFKAYARDNYSVELTDEQARESRVSFFELYSKLDKWHTNQRTYAARNGYVRSLSGRKRRLPNAQLRADVPERDSAQRQAINSPVQSFANDLNLMSALEIRQTFTREQVRICATVHDSILMWVRKDIVHKVVPRVLKIMSHPKLLDTLKIILRVPIEAEAKIGPWSKGVSLEKWMKNNAHT